MTGEWETDQFTDALQHALELACGVLEAIDVGEVDGWRVRPLHETDRPTPAEGLEIRTPRGTFVLVVHKVADRG